MTILRRIFNGVAVAAIVLAAISAMGHGYVLAAVMFALAVFHFLPFGWPKLATPVFCAWIAFVSQAYPVQMAVFAVIGGLYTVYAVLVIKNRKNTKRAKVRIWAE